MITVDVMTAVVVVMLWVTVPAPCVPVVVIVVLVTRAVTAVGWLIRVGAVVLLGRGVRHRNRSPDSEHKQGDDSEYGQRASHVDVLTPVAHDRWPEPVRLTPQA